MPVSVKVGAEHVICNGVTTDTDGMPLPLDKTVTTVVVEQPFKVFVVVAV